MTQFEPPSDSPSDPPADPQPDAQADDAPTLHSPTQAEIDAMQAALLPEELESDERRRRRRAPEDPEATAKIRKFVIEAAQLMHDRHCEDIVVFDVRDASEITDYVIIATGTSDRQMVNIASELKVLARDNYNIEAFGKEVDDLSTWIVTDFVDVMTHLFEPATRSHYDLEMMWGDAPTVHWQR